jgi:hypothetical protein
VGSAQSFARRIPEPEARADPAQGAAGTAGADCTDWSGWNAAGAKGPPAFTQIGQCFWLSLVNRRILLALERRCGRLPTGNGVPAGQWKMSAPDADCPSIQLSIDVVVCL